MADRTPRDIYNKSLRVVERAIKKNEERCSHAYLEDKTARRTKVQKIKYPTASSSSLDLNEVIVKKPKSDTSIHLHKSVSSFASLQHPVKSERDKKVYKVIVLENGLRCCLISDEHDNLEDSEWEDISGSESSSDDDSDPCSQVEEDITDTDALPDTNVVKELEKKMAAVALCVGVGSFSDPLEVPGMAHFLEHMVFMGSEKYPKENDFDSFITKSGGSDNAATDCEVTTFYFEVLEKYLYKGMDKFAQFFISPLCRKESMLKEREAIDSEFSQAKPKDCYRAEQMFFNMFRNDAKINKFTWGNLKTLLYSEVGDDKLHDMMMDFRKKYYVAKNMTLAVQARLPIEILIQYVTDLFSEIPAGEEIPTPFYKQLGCEVFNREEFNKIYYVKPVKNTFEIILTWLMPSKMSLYKIKPHHYVASLIGDESKGSLLSYLKHNVWALSMEAGCEDGGSEHNSIYCLFQIKITLTEEGLDNIFDVINAVYGYINMLKEEGPSKRYYKELQQLHEIGFKYQEECSAEDNVKEIAENMQYFPPKDVLTAPSLFKEFSEEEIKNVLSCLVPKNMNIMIFSSCLPPDIYFDCIEDWFYTLYTVRDIPQHLYVDWVTQEVLDEFSFPTCNQFITRDFGLIEVTSKQNETPTVPRKILLKDNFCEIWFLPDSKFRLPIAHYNIHLVNTKFLENAENACMTDLLVKMLELMISEETYQAVVAHLSYSISTSDLGFLIKVYGFSEKIDSLLLIIARYLKNISNICTENLFNVVKQKLLISYNNNFFKPAKLAKDLRLKVILGKYYTMVQKHEVATMISFEKFQQFLKTIFEQVFLQVLAEGNLTESDVYDTTFSFNIQLNFTNLMRAPYLVLKDNFTEKGLKDVNELCTRLSQKYNVEFSIVDSNSEIVGSIKPSTQIETMQVLQLPLGEHCVRTHNLNVEDVNSVVTNYYQIGPYTPKLSVTLDLLMMIIEEPLFDTLRTKSGLGYQVYASSRNTFNILGYTITVVSQEYKHTTIKVEECIEVFRNQIGMLLRKMSKKKFKTYVSDLLKIKKISDINLAQQVERHWEEIISQNFLFHRNDTEIQALEELTLAYLRKFWDTYNTVKANGKFCKLSIQVVGNTKYPEVDKDTSKIQCNFRARKKNAQYDEEQKFVKANKQIFKIDLIGSKEETWAENKAEGYFIRNIEIFVSVLPYFVTSVSYTK